MISSISSTVSLWPYRAAQKSAAGPTAIVEIGAGGAPPPTRVCTPCSSGTSHQHFVPLRPGRTWARQTNLLIGKADRRWVIFKWLIFKIRRGNPRATLREVSMLFYMALRGAAWVNVATQIGWQGKTPFSPRRKYR